jgi:hypothetical protein
MAWNSKDWVDVIQKQMAADAAQRIARSMEEQAKVNARNQEAETRRHAAEANRLDAEAEVYLEQKRQIQLAAQRKAEQEEERARYTTVIAHTEYLLPKINILPDDSLKYCLVADYLNDVARQCANGSQYLDSVDQKRKSFELIEQINGLKDQVAHLSTEFKQSIFSQYWELAPQLLLLLNRAIELDAQITAKGGPLGKPKGCLLAFSIFAFVGVLGNFLDPKQGTSVLAIIVMALLFSALAAFACFNKIEFFFRREKLVDELNTTKRKIANHPIHLVVTEIRKRFPQWSDLILRNFRCPAIDRRTLSECNECTTAPVKTFSTLAICSFVLGLLSLGLLFVTGIPAVVTGHIALNRINEHRGRGLAVTGLSLGYFALALTLFGIIRHLIKI